jgi:hypothetical protein
MAARTGMARRIGTVARWPVGMGLTSWRYLWRVTALHREDHDVVERPVEPQIPDHLCDEHVQLLDDGRGPVFHRTYRVNVTDPERRAEEVIDELAAKPNTAAPVEVAVFRKRVGRDGDMHPGDELVVRMPGPWDGPVRVVDRTPTSYRFATMQGHLEAGQIEFRARDTDEGLDFEIESWTTGGTWLSELLYGRVRLIKEMQLHMWTHYCERVAALAGGTVADGVWITTERYERDERDDAR